MPAHDPSRREFLKVTGFGALGLLGLGYASGTRLLPELRAEDDPHGVGLGRLVKGEGVMALPAGFSCVAFSRAGEVMDDGLRVPAAHDGMAAFPGPDGRTILVRNHELIVGDDGAFGRRNELFGRVPRDRVYDAAGGEMPCLGGTTTLVFDTRTQRVERQFLSLAGTLRNCAGGPTPWGSWITCEESVQLGGGPFERDHGYCFEVPARATPGLAEPTPLRALGRFNHEAVCVDPRSGLLYQTEDRGDGLLYRFVPARQERLLEGGRLQALVVVDLPSADTSNHGARPTFAPGEEHAVRWIDLEDVDARADDLRHRGAQAGAAGFARGEGIAYGEDGAIYVACTSGGPARRGQVWRYTPDPERELADEGPHGTLSLLVEPNDPSVFDMIDNLVVAPWGDVILAEDGPGQNHVVGVTPEGQVYKLARNVLNSSELAGITFSPDGSTLFVNVQRDPGLTVAIRGPWPKARPKYY